MDKKVIQEYINVLSNQAAFIQSALSSAQTTLQHVQQTINMLIREVNKPPGVETSFKHLGQREGRPSWSGPLPPDNMVHRPMGPIFGAPPVGSDPLLDHSSSNALGHYVGLALRRAGILDLKTDYPTEDDDRLVFTFKNALKPAHPGFSAGVLTGYLDQAAAELRGLGYQMIYTKVFGYDSPHLRGHDTFGCEVELHTPGIADKCKNINLEFRIPALPKENAFRPMPDHNFESHGTEIPLPDSVRNEILNNLHLEVVQTQQVIHETVLSALKAAGYSVIRLEDSVEENSPPVLTIHYQPFSRKPDISKTILDRLMHDLDSQWRAAGRYTNIKIGKNDAGVTADIFSRGDNVLLTTLNFVLAQLDPSNAGGVNRDYMNAVVFKKLEELGCNVISEHYNGQLGVTLHYSGGFDIDVAVLSSMTGPIASQICNDGHQCVAEVITWKEGSILAITVANNIWTYGFELIPSTPADVKKSLKSVRKEIKNIRSWLDWIVTSALGDENFCALGTEHVNEYNTIVYYKLHSGGRFNLDLKCLNSLMAKVSQALEHDDQLYNVTVAENQNGLQLELQKPGQKPFLTYTFVVKADQ